MNHFTNTALCFMTLVFFSCGGEDTVYDEKQENGVIIPSVDYDEFSQELVDLENKILANASQPDEKLLQEATTKFQDFAGYFPEDPKAPDYLLKASDYALTLGQPEKSVKILTRIRDEYPTYSKMEDVMFNRASHMDFELRDTTNAKIAYQEFIDRFPASELVDDAQERIENISLSLEELADKFIRDMEKKPQ
jgi:outer membrane protein assembly factor BamD (BamD/ComL family)